MSTADGGKGAKARRESKRKSERIKRQLYFESIFAENIDPERAFKFVTRRIKWLNEKIAERQDEGRHWTLYLEEREALLWMMDTIQELSRRLLAATAKEVA